MSNLSAYNIYTVASSVMKNNTVILHPFERTSH